MAGPDPERDLAVAPIPVPVLHGGILVPAGVRDPAVHDTTGRRLDLRPIGQTGRWLIDPVPQSDVWLSWSGQSQGDGALPIQIGGWAGRVLRVTTQYVTGQARNLRAPDQDVAVLAFDDDGIVAVATARAAQGGQFTLILPRDMACADRPHALTLGIAGSDYLLEGGHLTVLPHPETRLSGGQVPALPNALTVVARPAQRLAIRIKIATPNLKEAPLWGDYHFANSLAAAFERIGHQANVDTADQWYARPAQEDVVLTIRGRHRVKIDRRKINLMWVISHPDRMEAGEYADYDHVFVASDIYAAELRAQGHDHVSVLHQATDATLFGQDFTEPRLPACLFVGNSRREYRTMIKWCLQAKVPLELYGGGWDGVLAENMVRGQSVANADLPQVYARHLLLLNDHWDSMRENGFLSNRLFDGSAAGTPLLTDPVAGLAEVFGDTIATAATGTEFAAQVAACLAEPEAWLARAAQARDIVLRAHTFDHRAATLSDWIERLQRTRLGVRITGPQ